MLPDWLAAVLLGIVEGLTEFIPVSSTGHLLLAEHFLPGVSPLFRTDFFNVVVQSGAVLAVIPLFSRRLQMLWKWREPASRALLSKIFAAFLITAAGGLVLNKLHFKLPETIQPVAWALIAGGFAFVLAERWLKNRSLSDSLPWNVVIAVAAAQLLAAVFPGTSRSGATILAALLLGTSRPLATEFSFLVGIPTLLAAAGLKLLKELQHPAVSDQAPLVLLASVTSAAVSFIAVRWLLRYVQSHSFSGFGFYRIALGTLLLLAALAS
jgi:undecaprenyl-diphosphatase